MAKPWEMREWHNGADSIQDLHFIGFWIVKRIIEWELGTNHETAWEGSRETKGLKVKGKVR